ncbi:MAG: hypothetical protein IJ801_07655 [Lachnospiraceae bacterium]|nr:hypothetical protein [Lachnospiraceae bacterium]
MSKRKIAICLVAAAMIWGILLVFFHKQRNRTYSGIAIANRAEVVASMREGLRQHSRQITIQFTAHSDSMENIREMAEGMLEEALEETDNPSEGDYIRFQYGGYELGCGCDRDGGQYTYRIRLVPDYYTSVEQEEIVTEEIDRVLASLHFDRNTSEYEKVRAIYDYVYRTVAYDEVHKNKEQNHLKTTAYSALIYKTAVCQGYSVLLYRLFREAGIGARVVTGTAVLDGKEELHAWNIVRIDGFYYNLDATWGRALETEAYFLKCDAEFGNHIRDERYRTEEFYRLYPMADRNYEP